MIDMKKKYRTRDGREVRIYATDGDGAYPVHGAVNDLGGWVSVEWTEAGQFWAREHNPTDLVEVVEPKTVWINLDEDGNPTSFKSKQDALTWRFDDHLHTYKVELTEADIVKVSDE
jgi:hypothetical protein